MLFAGATVEASLLRALRSPFPPSDHLGSEPGGETQYLASSLLIRKSPANLMYAKVCVLPERTPFIARHVPCGTLRTDSMPDPLLDENALPPSPLSDPLLDLPPTAGVARTIGRVKKLTPHQQTLIYHLAIAGGHTQARIAAIVGCHQSAVQHWLAQLRPTTELAKLRSYNRSLALTEATLDAVMSQAKRGRTGPGLETLDRLGILKKTAPEKQQGTTVNVVVGMP